MFPPIICIPLRSMDCCSSFWAKSTQWLFYNRQKSAGQVPVSFSGFPNSNWNLWLTREEHCLACICQKCWRVNLMLRQTPCEKFTVEKDVIQLEFQSPRMPTPWVFLLSEIRGETQGRDMNTLRWYNSTEVYPLHAWWHSASESGADIWPLGLVS